MNTIRSLASTGATLHRLLFMVGIAGALIASLLAMHTLTTATHQVDAAPAMSSAADHHQAMAGAAVDGTVDDARPCLGDCGAPGDMPHRAILMTACVLALLAAAIVVLAPALLARLSTSLGAAVLVVDVPRALPRPQPPSLLVLSISRT